ncbi:MAG: methyltransferase domain-containing protein [Cyanobacteria bacterium P01_G01_bin.49]
MVLEATDLSLHLHKSYELLSQLALPQYPDLNATYIRICQAIDKQELGWSFYLCQKVSDRLSWIHQNKDTQELQSKYDAWARLYETDIGKSWEIIPRNAAGMLKQLLPRSDIFILDAGAGSGMAGEALAFQGYNNITAIDLSPEMLEIARKKQVYKALQTANLETPLTFCEEESFDAILAIGVFTYGHASPVGLDNLLPVLKQGGIFILTVRLSNKPMQEAFTKLPWTLISQQEYTFEDAPFHILAYRKD